MFAIVEQDGTTISDSAGTASIAAGTTASLSIVLNLDPDETASFFEGHFVFSISGALAVSSSSEPVESDWDSVVENTAGNESVWSETSQPLSGLRLVAHWVIDATAASPGSGLLVQLEAGTFAGTDLDAPPFFALLDLMNDPEEQLGQVNVVPEPTALALIAAGLAMFCAIRRGVA
jgi:hypothetical protein